MEINKREIIGMCVIGILIIFLFLSIVNYYVFDDNEDNETNVNLYFFKKPLVLTYNFNTFGFGGVLFINNQGSYILDIDASEEVEILGYSEPRTINGCINNTRLKIICNELINLNIFNQTHNISTPSTTERSCHIFFQNLNITHSIYFSEKYSYSNRPSELVEIENYLDNLCDDLTV